MFGSRIRVDIAMNDYKENLSEKLPCINKVEVDKIELTLEEDPRAVGGSENVDSNETTTILFLKIQLTNPLPPSLDLVRS